MALRDNFQDFFGFCLVLIAFYKESMLKLYPEKNGRRLIPVNAFDQDPVTGKPACAQPKKRIYLSPGSMERLRQGLSIIQQYLQEQA